MAKTINYYYTKTKKSMELDFRQMPIKPRLLFIYGLLRNKIIVIPGKNKTIGNKK